jgi:uncharacterized protein (TIGR00297 family)
MRAFLTNTNLTAVAVTVVFSGAAWLLNGVTVSGALAGAVVTLAMYVSAGPGAFVALVFVFVIALATTRLGYARKQQLGTAERGEGRSASQVFANLGVAALAAVLFRISQHPIWLIAATAALAEAAADTASSEVGQASSETVRLITSLARVPAGTDGGITVLGTVAGAIAASLVAACCVVVNLIPSSAFAVVSVAGFCGMLLDSVLGALFERRAVLNNDMVNLLGTIFSGAIAMIIVRNFP